MSTQQFFDVFTCLRRTKVFWTKNSAHKNKAWAKVVEVDPFDTSVAGAVIPELAEKEVPQQQQQEESAAAIEHSDSIDSDDFDPRAF